MKELNYTDYANEFVDILRRGAFLTTAAAGKTNTMTIGWGAIGFMWGKPVLTVMVRQSRYTYELIQQNPEFTVSVPLGDMKAALGICGSHSGRTEDKFALAGLTPLPPQKISVPGIKGAGLHFECRTLCQQVMSADGLDTDVADKWYADKDWHVMYHAEIISAYTE